MIIEDYYEIFPSELRNQDKMFRKEEYIELEQWSLNPMLRYRLRFTDDMDIMGAHDFAITCVIREVWFADEL